MMHPRLLLFIIGITIIFSSCHESTNPVDRVEQIESVSPKVEGPYQFKTTDHQLFYANSSAQRFQLIDISKLDHPYLANQMPLSGYPQAFYVRGSQYLLVQHHPWLLEGNRFTVLYQTPTGDLTTLQDFTLSGELIASQRRGSLIYGVTRSTHIFPNALGKITVFNWNHQGELELIKSLELSDSVGTVAMFPDYFVLTSSQEGNDPKTTKVQIFALSSLPDPLVELPSIQIEGEIFSTSHLDIFNQQLRVAYFSKEKQSTVVAIYDLSSAEMALIGKVDLMPSESISPASRFIGQHAWIVTQGNQLWGVDLTDPFSLQVTSPIEMTGQVYELASDDTRLLILHSREVNQQNRLELSLVDITLFHQPLVISQFVPAQVSQPTETFWEEGKTLFLNESEHFALLPFNSETHHSLQRISLAPRSLEEAGRFDSPVSLQKVFQLTSENFVVLGDQMLLTLHWPLIPSITLPQELGRLELAVAITKLQGQEGELWAIGENSPQVYRYTSSELGIPDQQWTLSQNYSGFEMDQHWVIFYTTSPLTVQVLDTLTGQLSSPQILSETTENMSGPFVDQGGLYYADQLHSDSQETPWKLHRWDVQNFRETSNWSIPGNPGRFFMIHGELITQEVGSSGQLHLNRWTLEHSSVHLLDSREFPCLSSSQMFLEGESIYINCGKEYKIRYYGPWGPVYEENQTLTTQILKLNPGLNFLEEGDWTFAGILALQAVASETILVTSEPLKYRYHLPYTHCEVYRVIPGQEPFLLKQLDTCAGRESTVLTPHQIWMAQEFAGLREARW